MSNIEDGHMDAPQSSGSGKRRLSDKQRGVFAGMAAAVVITIVAIAAAIIFPPAWLQPHQPFTGTFAFAMHWDVVVVLCLGLNIGALARHRFFTPEDIDGGGLTAGTAKAHILQSTLQNTLEQTVLAIGAHATWALVMPRVWVSAVPVAAMLFIIGRILFWLGYRHGAPARSLGFALTFYPSLFMLASALGYMIFGLVA